MSKRSSLVYPVVATSVRHVTRHRHVDVVLFGAMAAVGLACGSSSNGVDTATSLVTGTSGGTETPYAGQPTEEPGSLCTLAGPPAATPGDVIVGGDDFEGKAVDTSKWTVADGYRGHGTILNSASPANATVHDGSLFIATDNDPTNATYPYKSGWIDTEEKFARTYGKLEIRAKFPFATGVWYAIWGRPWGQSFPEIDIELMNIPGKKKTEVYFVNHWAAPPLPADQRRSFTVFDTIDVTQFHTYTVLWKPGVLEWSVDGVVKMTAPPQGVPNRPVYWMLNGWVGGWGGLPVETTKFPATFEVDYVHISRVDGVIADPVIHVVDQKTTYTRQDSIEIRVANFDEACAHVEMYDGDRLVWRTSTAPFRFPLSKLSRAGAGKRSLSFVATDGVRKTTEPVEFDFK